MHPQAPSQVSAYQKHTARPLMHRRDPHAPYAPNKLLPRSSSRATRYMRSTPLSAMLALSCHLVMSANSIVDF